MEHESSRPRSPPALVTFMLSWSRLRQGSDFAHRCRLTAIGALLFVAGALTIREPVVRSWSRHHEPFAALLHSPSPPAEPPLSPPPPALAPLPFQPLSPPLLPPRAPPHSPPHSPPSPPPPTLPPHTPPPRVPPTPYVPPPPRTPPPPHTPPPVPPAPPSPSPFAPGQATLPTPSRAACGLTTTERAGTRRPSYEQLRAGVDVYRGWWRCVLFENTGGQYSSSGAASETFANEHALRSSTWLEYVEAVYGVSTIRRYPFSIRELAYFHARWLPSSAHNRMNVVRLSFPPCLALPFSLWRLSRRTPLPVRMADQVCTYDIPLVPRLCDPDEYGYGQFKPAAYPLHSGDLWRSWRASNRADDRTRARAISSSHSAHLLLCKSALRVQTQCTPAD